MISILAAIGKLAKEAKAPVIEAVRRNLATPGVAEVHVLSKDDLSWLVEEVGAAPEKLHIVKLSEGPTSHSLVEAANRLFASGANHVALMRASVSFSSAQDVTRLLSTFRTLDDSGQATAFLLTAQKADDPDMPATGLAGSAETDAWVFQQPITVGGGTSSDGEREIQRISFTEDLIVSGYALFNPSLDVKVVQHAPEPGSAYPDPFTYHDDGPRSSRHHSIAWISTEWLKRGYRPQPTPCGKKAILLAVDEGNAHGNGEALERFAELCMNEGCDGHVLCAGNADAYFQRYASLFSRNAHLSLCPVSLPVEKIREAFLRGDHIGFDSVGFVNDLSRITPEILLEADAVFASRPDFGGTQPDPSGCTLITSVFRSDEYLQGFVNNCLELEGYGSLLEHIFLVAKMSPLEIELLNRLLATQPNVLVFWNRKDPGLYPCWNLGIRIARQDYVSNANVDDLRDPAHVMALLRDLESNPDVLVAASAINPFHEYPSGGALPDNRDGWYSDRPGRFGFFDLARLAEDGTDTLVPHNIPHCMPVWRRSLHERFGWFNEARYGTFADWAFWLRVLNGGGYGWLNPAPIGFYFVNPMSHNRRGTELERLHKVVESEFMGMFTARRDTGAPHKNKPCPAVEPKLNLTGLDQMFGVHRNSFNRIVQALEPLDCGTREGVAFLPFIERYFVWGTDPGEAASRTPAPILRDWVGILHVPFDSPDWFNPAVSPEVIFETELWKQSLPRCRGILTFSADLERDLRAACPDIPTLSLLHPSETDVTAFQPESYRADPTVVQVGDWLRKLQAIHRLAAPGHKRIMLLKGQTEEFMMHEIARFGDYRDPAVDVRSMIPNDEYDSLLSRSVVMCLMYATAANNVVVECLARATPLLVNPLPAVIEYLGHDYPLYATDEDEAAALLAAPETIDAAHEYLLKRRNEIDLSYEGLPQNIADSEWYARL